MVNWWISRKGMATMPYLELPPPEAGNQALVRPTHDQPPQDLGMIRILSLLAESARAQVSDIGE